MTATTFTVNSASTDTDTTTSNILPPTSTTQSSAKIQTAEVTGLWSGLSDSQSKPLWRASEHLKLKHRGSLRKLWSNVHDTFGFRGPEYSQQPTVITTGLDTPLIVVQPTTDKKYKTWRPDGEDSSTVAEVQALTPWKDNHTHARSHKSRIANGQDTNYLTEPPKQFTRKVRNAYAAEQQKAQMDRLQRILNPETIQMLQQRAEEEARSKTESAIPTCSAETPDPGHWSKRKFGNITRDTADAFKARFHATAEKLHNVLERHHVEDEGENPASEGSNEKDTVSEPST